jgi:anaerobic selenocysteine-containing dehydrogenase
MLIQNTNPANVAPEQRKVHRGAEARGPVPVVHEQFMTDTAQLADVVLPATMFLEHDDIYRGGGHQHIVLGPKLVDPPEGPMPNHVVEELGKRLGVADREGFGLTERQHIDMMLAKTGPGETSTASRRTNGPMSSPISKPRISSPALPTRMASTASGPTGPERRPPTSRPGAWARKGQSTGCPSFPIMSN